MLIIAGGLENFSQLIKDNLQIGLYNDKPYPILVCSTYIKESISKPNEQKTDLIEIVMEIMNTTLSEPRPEGTISIPAKYLVTRQVGADNSSLPKNSRISLIYEKNNQIYMWSPFFKELFDMYKTMYSQWSAQGHLYNLKIINEQLVISKDFKVEKFVNYYGEDYLGVKRPGFNDYIPTTVFYSLIKQIMISEDIRYSSNSQSGRYRMLTAMIEYATTDISIDDVLDKYGI